MNLPLELGPDSAVIKKIVTTLRPSLPPTSRDGYWIRRHFYESTYWTEMAHVR